MANGSTRRAGTAKRATKRRAPAKKAPAKRATAARKTTARKAATKRAPARKAAPRKAAARRAATKKAAPARKTATKRTTAKAAPARKAAAKKAATPSRATTAPTAGSTPPAAPAAAVVVDQSPTPPSTPAVAAPPVRTATRAPRQRSLTFTITGAVLVVAAFVLLVRMNAQERGGPTHGFVSIGEGIPATLYVPYPDEDDGLPVAPPKEERAPVIVLAHGYSADRASMSGLARSYTEAGYAVLSFDFRGHGANTHRFQGDLRDDFAAAVDWAETSPYVDGENIAVMGHSMGAGAALDFATLDARPKAVIPLSGGWVVNDGVVPANTLFVVAENDPDRIHDRQQALADQLTQLGGTVGQVEVGGSDHVTVLRKDKTVSAVTEFLDPILGIERAEGDTPGIEDPRFKTAFLYLIVAFALVALLGSVVGRAAPAGPQTDPAGPAWGGFALLIGALVVTMPVLGAGQFDLLPIGAGQPIVVHVALASGLLWGLRSLARRGQLTGRVAEWLGPDRPWLSLRSSGWTGLAAAGIVIALLMPLGPVVHRFVPTPQRAVYWVVMAAIALPFFAAYHGLIRRGEGWTAILIGAIGRIVLIVILFLGLAVGVLPMVISLVIPLLVLQYLLLELFAGGCYASSRNTTVIAIVDAVVIGWVATTLTPVG